MKPSAYLDDIRNLIGKDQIPQAIDRLKKIFDQSPQLNKLILNSARFHHLMNQIHAGTIEKQDADDDRTQITESLLALIDEIDDQKQVSPYKEEIQEAISIIHSKNVIAGSNP